ncbi:MAG TPA: phage holin family protein, partial [Terriglobales bacterium]|nr:phage holin family protein [Terriglobales bacterium]
DQTVNFNGRSFAGVVNEVKDELKEFLQTRIAMLKSELGEKMRTIKAAVPMLATAIVFLVTAYLLFTLCLVALISVAFYGNPFRWFLSFIIVAVLYSIVGGMAAVFGLKELRAQGLMPKKTIKVLKEDQIWLQHEARTQV